MGKGDLLGRPPLNCLPKTWNRLSALGNERKPVLKHIVTAAASALIASYAMSSRVLLGLIQ